MSYYPINYDNINKYQGTFTPSDKYSDSLAFKFWMRALYQRALSVFDIEDLPEDFSRQEIDLLYYLIYINGFCGSFDTTEYDLIINPVTLKGYNVFYAPESFIAVNPVFKRDYEYKIYHLGDNKLPGFKKEDYGVLLVLSPDHYGIYDILIYYAEKLANMSAGLDMNIENSKLAYVLGANSRSGVNFLKKVIDKIKSGVTAIIADSRITKSEDFDTFEFFNRDSLKNSYMVTEFNSDIQTLINQFDAEIGIINVPYEKKERMTDFESRSKQSDGVARAMLWKETLQKSFDEFNELYGYNVKVTYNYENMTANDPDDETKINLNKGGVLDV